MRVFLDTNVILDVLSARQPFFEDSQRVLSYCESNLGTGFVSVLTFCTVEYVLRKAVVRERLRPMLRRLRHVLAVLPMSDKTVDGAIDSNSSDFEDALQYECAFAGAADVIVTRDKRGFAHSEIQVLSPTEFVAHYY